MSDSTVKKVQSATAPRGAMGQRYLVAGKSVSMRFWDAAPPQAEKEPRLRDYETVGYVISGRATLHLEDQAISLTPGDAWLVPARARHHYRIEEPFTAVEATAPPAEFHGRDEPPG
jgi:quercetin dioxygenase-like cupin family protein